MGKTAYKDMKEQHWPFFISKPRANIYKIGRFIVLKAQAAAYFGSQGLLGNTFPSVILLNLKENFLQKKGIYFNNVESMHKLYF